MQVQTVFKAGNSNVVALPKDLGFRVGDKITINKLNGGLFIEEAVKQKPKKAIAKEFQKWLKDVLKEDKEILDELAIR